jgi:anaerobic ribonucleoside-triphosphate reductase activating protein|nr:MAG TPA: 4Fe-4S single cluster domain protein [Caudoviricetes sp.]
MNTLYVAKIAHSTSVDGPGLRNSLYVSGCHLQCEGCHNQPFWDIHSGRSQTIEEVYDALNVDDFNISILGGEPLMQYDSILQLCEMIKKQTSKTIWLWSGHTLETIQKKYPLILSCIDVLIDGPFVEKYAEPNLKWRGSYNQRIINVNNELK